MDDNIEPKMYRQECSACGHGELYFLPSLDKKIIYLDQFALSEMQKSIEAYFAFCKEQGREPEEPSSQR